jgi:CBS domain containing-hemolysin-like protein
METGVFALSPLRIRQRMNQGNKRARTLYRYLENPEDFLWTIMVGNTLANLTAFSVGVIWLHSLPGMTAPVFWLVVLVGGVVFYALIELLPKMLIRLYPNRLCMFLAPPFRLLDVLLRPLVAPMAFCSRWLLRWSDGKRFTGHLFGNRDEFRQVMRESAQGLTTEERSMIDRVLDLQNLTVRQITIPMAKVVTVTAETPMRDVLAVCRQRRVSRVPVWKGEGEDRCIVGLVSLNPLIYRSDLDLDRRAGDYVKAVLALDYGARLEEALRKMQSRRQRLAIVMGADGSELGVVSLQDILKFMFGEVSL